MTDFVVLGPWTSRHVLVLPEDTDPGMVEELLAQLLARGDKPLVVLADRSKLALLDEDEMKAHGWVRVSD